jgi:predicted N-acetyltransferase YhbS
MITIRELQRRQVQDVWTLDRSEVIDGVYYLRNGQLILESEHYDLNGWPSGEPEQSTSLLLDCFDRGGTFYGAFEEDKLVGAAILESKFIGQDHDQLQLVFLHVSRAYRNRGLGRTLFEKSVARARELGARRLYISATPSENTIHFYLGLGCAVTGEVDPDLFEREPEDIHLEYAIP